MRNMFLFLLLAACAPSPPVYKPVTVDMPVAVRCSSESPVPPHSPLQQTNASASLFDKVKAALIEIDLRKAYEARLSAALAACR